MTSKLTREWLQHQISAIEAVGITDSNTLAAFKLALAAMESEPVGMFRKSAVGYTPSYHEDVVPLYRHAQPAPDGEQLAIENFRSAMEGIGHISRTLEETFGGLRGTHVEPDVLMDCNTICDAIYAAYSGNSPVIPDGYAMVPKEPTEDMRDAYYESSVAPISRLSICGYQAMLAAAQQSPGSEPATAPGKWIPVSERMPEDSGRYWCYVEEQNDLGKSHYQWNCSWNGDRWWVESEGGGIVTHWMPLPAAPQE